MLITPSLGTLSFEYYVGRGDKEDLSLETKNKDFI